MRARVPLWFQFLVAMSHYNPETRQLDRPATPRPRRPRVLAILRFIWAVAVFVTIVAGLTVLFR